MVKEIALSVIGTLLTVSLALNFFLLRGYDFMPPATHQEQVIAAQQILAREAYSVEEKHGK